MLILWLFHFTKPTQVHKNILLYLHSKHLRYYRSTVMLICFLWTTHDKFQEQIHKLLIFYGSTGCRTPYNRVTSTILDCWATGDFFYYTWFSRNLTAILIGYKYFVEQLIPYSYRATKHFILHNDSSLSFST